VAASSIPKAGANPSAPYTGLSLSTAEHGPAIKTASPPYPRVSAWYWEKPDTRWVRSGDRSGSGAATAADSGSAQRSAGKCVQPRPLRHAIGVGGAKVTLPIRERIQARTNLQQRVVDPRAGSVNATLPARCNQKTAKSGGS